jgi:gluconokinase
MIIIIMGVSGSGKTTIGTLFAARMGWLFEDADSYHPPENIEKLSAAIPLTDADREPWLRHLADSIRDWHAAGKNVVLACSALKNSYRSKLRVNDSVCFAYLKVSQEVIEQRLRKRRDHFMNPELLESQFQTLEEPKDAIVIDASKNPDHCVAELMEKLALSPRR